MKTAQANSPATGRTHGGSLKKLDAVSVDDVSPSVCTLGCCSLASSAVLLRTHGLRILSLQWVSCKAVFGGISNSVDTFAVVKFEKAVSPRNPFWNRTANRAVLTGNRVRGALR